MTGEKGTDAAPKYAAEKALATEVANKIWADCQTGTACKDKNAVGKVLNADLDQILKSHPEANPFVLTVDLDTEISARQAKLVNDARAGGTKALSGATQSDEFVFAGRMHRLLESRIDKLEAPADWKPGPCTDCQ